VVDLTTYHALSLGANQIDFASDGILLLVEFRTLSVISRQGLSGCCFGLASIFSVGVNLSNLSGQASLKKI
jgi:hypothetical protein